MSLALLGSCAGSGHEPTIEASANTPAPPSTFVEVEPGDPEQPNPPPPTPLAGLRLVLHDGLVAGLSASPVALGGGRWGVELVLEVHNDSTTSVFDMGAEPHFIPWISVTHADGSGRGSAGGCSHVFHMHGGKTHAFGPGEELEAVQLWEDGVGPGDRLEMEVHLCDIGLPDGRSVGGEIAEYELLVDGRGELVEAELRPTPMPAPR